MANAKPPSGAQDLDDLPDDLIEIRDPDIDAREIMAEIRRRIRQRRAELGYETQQFPSYDGVVFPGKPDDIPYDVNLYHHLELVNKMYLEVETGALLAPSPATRLPILGRLWALVRSQAHNLVLFYVNRSLEHQTEVNRRLISVLNQLTAANQEQQRSILTLQEQIDQLRSQLAE